MNGWYVVQDDIEPNGISPSAASRASDDSVDGQPDIQAVGRAAQILGLFSNESPELTASSVAQRLGLNRSTAHRYLASLLSAGLVKNSDDGRGVVPGELAVQLGTFALSRRNVLDLAEWPMRALSDAAQMTVVLSIWGPSGAVVAKVHENRSRAVLITVPVGTQLSLDTAQSALFLAFSHDQLAMRRLIGSLPESSQRDILAAIERARTTGTAMKAFADGITSIAVPIFGRSGISATLALVHTTAMLPMRSDSVEVTRLRQIATDLTVQLGGSSY